MALQNAQTTEDAERAERVAKIARQNDFFRTCPLPLPDHGQWVFTTGVSAEGLPFMLAVVEAVRGFTAFTEDCDPYGTHEMGSVEVAGKKVWWKIDLYDENYEFGSEEPENPERTKRVLTVLFPDEY